jgi:hypothetical protein
MFTGIGAHSLPPVMIFCDVISTSPSSLSIPKFCWMATVGLFLPAYPQPVI